MSVRTLSSVHPTEEWSRIVRPRRAFITLDPGELWRYRELLVFLVWRNILIQYKQTLIGVAWAVVQPIVTMVVFALIFGTVAKLPSKGVPYPLLTLAAVIPWQFFANGLSVGSNSVVTAAHMIRKVYFPRLFIPLGYCLSGCLDLCIAMVLMAALMFWYGVAFSWSLLSLPLFALLALTAALGASLWLSALNVKYRDVKYIVPFIIQSGMYVSPVGFSSAVVPERWRLLYHLNPLVGVIDGFRWAILGSAFTPDWRGVALSTATVLFLFVTGLFYFQRMERSFADVI